MAFIKYRRKNFLFFKLFLIWPAIFFPVFVSAASFIIEPSSSSILPGDGVEVSLYLNSSDENINALEGRLVFDNNLKLEKINDGSSIISFWLEKPHLNNENEIIFSGIIPGGLTVERGPLFKAIFFGRNIGIGQISVKDSTILRNDGLGTPVPNDEAKLVIEISEKAEPSPFLLKTDSVPPENFQPIITRDQKIFSGKWFLVFATQDKESGISYYQISENERDFATATSPYLIKNQNLDKKILIKAVDRSGNELLVSIEPLQAPSPYKNFIIFGIIVLSGLIVFKAAIRFLWRKK